jgi:hypothetical protein
LNAKLPWKHAANRSYPEWFWQIQLLPSISGEPGTISMALIRYQAIYRDFSPDGIRNSTVSGIFFLGLRAVLVGSF